MGGAKRRGRDLQSAGALVAAIAVGCAADVRTLPEPRGDPRAVVVVDDATPRRAVVAAWVLGAPAVALRPLDTTAPLHVLYFQAALAWPAGTYAAASDGWGRALELPEQSFVGDWDEGTWTEVEPTALRPFVFPLESPIACAARSGCFVDAAAIACTVPCPTAPTPLPPAPPRPLVMGTCPAGWVADLEVGACRAYVGPRPSCEATQLAAPGAPCRSPGPECSGMWAADLDDARTVFVAPGAVSGDGSRGAPLGTLAEALARVPAAEVVALSAGAHASPPVVGGAVRVVGACAAATQLRAPGGLALSDAIALEALTVETDGARVTGRATLDGAVLRGDAEVSAASALEVRGAVITGRITTAASATLRLTDARVAGAIGATASASVSIERSWLDGVLTATSTPVRVSESVGATLVVSGGRLDLDRAVLDARGRSASALRASGAVTVEGQRLVVAGGTLDFGRGATVTLEDTRVDDAIGPVDAVTAEDAAVVLRRASFGAGFVRYVRVSNDLRPLVLEDLATQAGAAFGLDVRAPLMELRRLRLTSLSVLQIASSATPTETAAIVGEDLEMVDGVLRVRDVGRVELRRLHFASMRGSGLVLDAAPGSPRVVASDVVIEDTRATTDCPSRVCTAGAAVVLEGGGLELSRFRLSRNAGPALLVQALQERLHVHDGVIEDQEVGVALEVEVARLRGALESVQLIDVGQTCAPCGDIP